MKFNLTDNIIFKKEISSEDIKSYLLKTNEIFIKKLNLKEEAETLINTKLKRDDDAKIKHGVVFTKIVNNLLNKELNNDFLIDILKLNKSIIKKTLDLNAEEFHSKYQLSFLYQNRFSYIYNQGLSLLLLILHLNKLIHLPFDYKIPFILETNTGKRKREDYALELYPPILKEIRLLDSNNPNDDDARFLSKDNKEHLISIGSKLLLSLGWLNFEDVSIEELLEYKKLTEEKNIFNYPPPYSFFVAFLNFHFPNEFQITPDLWLKETRNIIKKDKRIKNTEKILSGIKNVNIQSSENHHANKKRMALDLISVKDLDFLKAELPEYLETINCWQNVENSYLKKVKLESYKMLNLGLSHLNTYLFYILPTWYKGNNCEYDYPKMPKDLKGNLFISRINQNSDNLPPTFVDFLAEKQKNNETSNEYHYAILKNINKFFDFIETYNEELEGCFGFTNSISEFDFPRVKKYIGTNKGLIPRHLFGLLMEYIQMLRFYNNLIMEKIHNDELSFFDIKEGLVDNKGSLINTEKIIDKVGFMPMLYWNKKSFVFKEIPNFLDFKIIKLKNGKTSKFPHPHLLNHIYIALQTGIRGNHIQWLDAEKYNSMVKDDGNIFVNLYVNTDKSKNNAWTPIVHKDVIDVLASQLKWRNLIDNYSFNEKKFYNNNEKTKWDKFYPIFSYGADGLPYTDNAYQNCWLNILVYFQNIVEKFDLNYIELAKLLPKGIAFNEFNMDVKLKNYGSKCKDVCELRWTSDITPHSARVSVVSHYITALPADVIGQYITGQTEAVVHHYVKLDPNYLTEIEKGQKDSLARLAIQKEFDQLTGKEKNHPILADREGSNIAQSIAINKMETIAKYGCISLNLKEEGKSGVDVLIEESNIKLAFNKTEICPYNNTCPSDLIKEMKGFRRCGVCPYAVRSIDHLPAIAVKKRQMMELLGEIENKFTETSTNQEKYTIEELDGIEEERQRITEELLGWIVSEEMLEANRKRLQSESDTSQYVVKKPEILIENLQQISAKENDVEYLLTRLSDCDSFPNLDTPMVRAKFDLLRRQLLARLGDFKNAFDMKLPQDPAHECAGLIKEVVNRYGLTQKQTVELLSTNMLSLEHKNEPLLGLNYGN